MSEALSPFTQVRLELFLHLQPRYLGAVSEGIYDQLGRLLMVYNDELEGFCLVFLTVIFFFFPHQHNYFVRRTRGVL
jgi:hypothetical protein